MKEFVEKLIGRLEEISVENTCSDCPYKAKCDEVQEHINDETTDLCGATIKALSIEIVNQLAEEYNNDVCEWKFETTGIVWHCNGCETYNLPYAMNLRIIADDFECKCPHCGKKIKVVE